MATQIDVLANMLQGVSAEDQVALLEKLLANKEANEKAIKAKKTVVDKIQAIVEQAHTDGVAINHDDLPFILPAPASKQAKGKGGSKRVNKEVFIYNGKSYSTIGRRHPDLQKLSPEHLDSIRKPNPAYKGDATTPSKPAVKVAKKAPVKAVSAKKAAAKKTTKKK